MPKKKKGELPSGNIRRQIYDHSEPLFDDHGNPVIDEKTGKQKRKRIYISVTAESSAEVNRIKSEIKAGKKKVSTPTSMTLYEAIEKYITSSDAILSPSTIRGYRTIQRNAFRGLMDKKLSTITNDMLRDAVNAECKRTKGTKNPKPISAKTVINEYGLVSAVLNMYIPNLDCFVKLPQIEHNKHDISSPDVIFNMVKDTDMELPVLLAMWLSFTESEILGLTKSKSISPDGHYITVKEVIVRDETGKEVVKNKGKQPARDRTLRIPDYIKGLIDKVETDRIVPMTGAALTKRFMRLVKKEGIPHMTFHDLRHVNASVMTLLNVPDKYAQERGGWHSDHIMKSRYMQTFSNQRAEIDTRIDDYMTDTIFHNSSEQKYNRKYKCWLELFEKQDSKTSRRQFDEFCNKNNINIGKCNTKRNT